ncbi:hypothetical protein C2G38_2205855 [Gigaspora rosea]|uniref:Uncharacterized protein n=1 Tax=Gigaspora rosea TaxID=44941 RepID=A0A397UMZ6_9GLOM|nr:hypothetical protein C2G38_2205855 [Gigaspora rosea]
MNKAPKGRSTKRTKYKKDEDQNDEEAAKGRTPKGQAKHQMNEAPKGRSTKGMKHQTNEAFKTDKVPKKGNTKK